MTALLYFLAGILACSAIDQKNLETSKKSINELTRILDNLAVQSALQKRVNRLKIPDHLRLDLLERSQDREENDENDDRAQSMEYYQELNNLRLEKQLEDDLQQALRLETDRICKVTGRCGCSGGRCGRTFRTIDRTVDDVEQLLDALNKDFNKERDRKVRKEGDRRQKYGVERYRNQRQRENRQEDQRLQEFDDIRQRLLKKQRQYDRREKYDDRRQRQDDRRQRVNGRWQDERRPGNNDRRERVDDRRQRQDTRQEYNERTQEYRVGKQESNRDDVDELFRDLGVTAKTYKNPDFDFVVLEVPESNDLQNRANDIKIVDVKESRIADLLKQQQSPYENNGDTEGRVGNLNLEDFVAYYEIIKKKLTNSLLKYIKGLEDGPYLSQLLPYQKRQIEFLKKSQFKTPLADSDLKAKIIQLLFGSLSHIKILPHSIDDQTIYVPRQIINAVPNLLSIDQEMRSKKKLLPLTLHQKLRKLHLVPKQYISKHTWRRSNQEPQPNYGVPFNLQVQGLGQII